jgi:formate hydrogenlyase subunit 6/NADH:ubiquinone oxidoreductase subunit I
MNEQATDKAVERKEINPQAITDFLKPRMGARFKTWLKICAHCGLCADTCHHYLASDRDPKMIPAHKVRFLTELLKKKGKVDEASTTSVICAGDAPFTAHSASTSRC